MTQPFSIHKVGLNEAKQILQGPNEPHTHDFEELLLGIEGGIDHFIDFKTKNLRAPFISFVTKGKMHRLKPLIINEMFCVWLIKFRSEFIPETIFQLYSYYHDHASLQLNQDPSFKRILSLCEIIDEEARQETTDYGVIRHLLSALFTMIESERRKNDANESGIIKTQNITFKNFLLILEENYHRPVAVDFYAGKLFMSARNLNHICQNILQKSVTEIIETRKLIEAKNLLAHSGKTISEIAYELGYNEKAYFTSVFKKRSGQTPSEFRNDMRRLLS